jgi:hypothetical protein
MTELQTGNEEPGTKTYADYWGTEDVRKHFLPDGEQYIEFKVMNEGAKTRFQKLTNQDLTIGRDNTAKVKMDPAAERHTLIKTSVTNWHMFKGGEPVGYSPQVLEKWLEVADPKIVEDLELAIRKANPWLQADMSVEEIDKEIDRLHELRRSVVDREAGEASSANK